MVPFIFTYIVIIIFHFFNFTFYGRKKELITIEILSLLSCLEIVTESCYWEVVQNGCSMSVYKQFYCCTVVFVVCPRDDSFMRN